jgi:acetylglutamate kinase
MGIRRSRAWTRPGRHGAARPRGSLRAPRRRPAAVLAPPAAGREGGILNLNVDSAAAAIAVALGSARLVFFTDVDGVRDGAGRTLGQLTVAEAEDLLASGAASGGMRPKLAAALAALGDGVGEIVIAGPERQADVLRGGRGGTRLVAA